MEKLTAAKAAKYLGCKVKDLYNDKVGELVGVDLSDENDTPLRVRHNTTWSLHESECLLMLRPLSSLSDTDAIEVAKTAFGDTGNLTVSDLRNWGEKFVCDFSENKILSYFEANFEIGSKDSAKIADYLRSKEYDVDNYLISGEAIELKP